jgi:Holliday junction resolvase RusA-like endonuclease
MDRSLIFTADGLPQPKGSTRSFRHAVTGAVVTTHDNPKTRNWQGRVASAAADAAQAAGWPLVVAGAVSVEARFTLLRPLSVSLRRRPYHVVKPDLDKLLRAVGDALTGVLWRDDAQVVTWLAAKRYAESGERARVDVWVRAFSPREEERA